MTIPSSCVELRIRETIRIRSVPAVVTGLLLGGVLLLAGTWGSAMPSMAHGAGVATPGVGEVSPVASPAIGEGGTDMANLETCLVGRWIHSHEDDTPDAKVYRPADYPFPPARGRDGFEFRPGGVLVYLGIARADGTEEADGRWTVEASNRVRIEVQNERIEPVTLVVISCDEETLKIER
jgi:hypothetical protein